MAEVAGVGGAPREYQIDLDPNKLETAKKFGATDLVNAKETDPVAEVRRLTEDGWANFRAWARHPDADEWTKFEK